MKILIADDSLVNLRMLEKRLQREKYELVPVRSGAAAWQAMQAADAPMLAILDWMMPDVSGLEIVKRVRSWEVKRRPYLIVLTASGGKQDTLEAFAAGVDDYVPKPYDPDLLVARINAGARILQDQNKLLEEVLYRESLLQPSTASTGPTELAPVPSADSGRNGSISVVVPKMVVTAGSPQPGASPSVQQVLATLCPLAETEALVANTLVEMGLGEFSTVRDPAEACNFTPEIGIVHFILMPDKSAWFDLLLETDRASARNLYQTFSGMEADGVPDADLVDVIGETLNLIQGKLKAVFKSQGNDLLVPSVPQSIPPEKVPGRVAHNAIHTRHLFKTPGITIRFTLYTYFSPVQRKPLRELSVATVLAEPLHPMENADLVLINRGTMLNHRSLRKVASLAEFAPRNLTHAVIEPSPLTALLPRE